jgi:hypothetical protein
MAKPPSAPPPDPFADKKAHLLDRLRAHPEGLTRTQVLRDVFNGMTPARVLTRIFNELQVEGKVVIREESREIMVRRTTTVISLPNPPAGKGA